MNKYSINYCRQTDYVYASSFDTALEVFKWRCTKEDGSRFATKEFLEVGDEPRFVKKEEYKQNNDPRGSWKSYYVFTKDGDKNALMINLIKN